MVPKSLHKYTILSTIFCFLSFLIVRITDTMILSVFLRFNHIYHKFGFFHIEYMPGAEANWTEGKVIFIYTLPYLIFALLGVYLPHIFRHKENLWIQLGITWLSFHMLLIVMAGLAAGVFQFIGPGVALAWLFVNMPVKIIGVAVLLSILLFNTRRFGWYFLREVPDEIYHDDYEHRRIWLNKAVLIPFIASFALIFPMSELETWLNFVFSFVLGLIFIAIVYKIIPMVYIPRSTDAD